MKGVHIGLRFPDRIEATSVARRPTGWPSASTTYHLRFSANPVPLGNCVDIDNSLSIYRLKRERLEYRTAPKNVKPQSAAKRFNRQIKEALQTITLKSLFFGLNRPLPLREKLLRR